MPLPRTLLAVLLGLSAHTLAVLPSDAAEPAAMRLPEGVLPALTVAVWTDGDFKPGGCRPFLDLMARHAHCNLLTMTVRATPEVTSEIARAQIKEGVAYARERGMGIAMDLDVRLARAAFQKAHPDELQEMLRLRETPLADSGRVTAQIESSDLSDHYTYRATHYVPLAGRLARVYSYLRGQDGIEPESIQDITDGLCTVEEAGAKRVRVSIACGPQTKGRRACVMAVFTHFAPDVFAPHLLSFQREILASYADVPLAGVCKDEWGFPPCYDGNPAKDDYWYSKFFAAAYAQRTGGRDLVRDALLMTFGQRGRQSQRQAAVNHFMDLCRQRNAAVEDDFYRATKATFGPKAVVATHPTWWPYPDSREFKKNGLDWWQATRDLAQTDETTPFCVRTALAKRWGSAVWYNMYYFTDAAAYEKGIWQHALGGGRINFHPLYPYPSSRGSAYDPLLRGGLMRGDCRIRLLNFIAAAPLDCPVAVVFGHACAVNWAGPAYQDVGMELANRLWRSGFYADLIPTSEIAAGALKMGQDGYLHYGRQRYAAVVLYHPEFERPQTAALFQQAAQGKTALFRVGDWTMNFDAEPWAGNRALPAAMVSLPDAASCAAKVVDCLRGLRVAPQEPATETVGMGDTSIVSPPAKGRCRLIDGTQIVLAGEKDVAGDPIRESFAVKGHEVTFDALGVAAVRLDDDGSLRAMAAGGLKHFRVGKLEIRLEQPVDVALWRDDQGQMHGVLQDWTGPPPPALAAICGDWLRLGGALATGSLIALRVPNVLQFG